MSLILRMIDKNHPIRSADTFLETGNGLGFSSGGKNPLKYAQEIFSALSHPKAVEVVAKGFHGLPQQVRIQLRTLCNDGNASGNVRKGVQRLNELLSGELLREEQRQYINVRIETAHGVGYRRQAVNPAVAGAQQKHADLTRFKQKKNK